jgi:hypothetical protein
VTVERSPPGYATRTSQLTTRDATLSVDQPDYCDRGVMNRAPHFLAGERVARQTSITRKSAANIPTVFSFATRVGGGRGLVHPGACRRGACRRGALSSGSLSSGSFQGSTNASAANCTAGHYGRRRWTEATMNRTLRSAGVPRSRGNTRRSMKLGVGGLAAILLMTAGLGFAGLGLAAGTARAEPGFAQFHGPFPEVRGPYQWCPGQPLPADDIVWDMSVCHTWYWVAYGFQANRGQFVYEGDTPPPDLGCIPFSACPGCSAILR